MFRGFVTAVAIATAVGGGIVVQAPAAYAATTVSNETELRDALNAGDADITLAGNIAVDKPIVAPASYVGTLKSNNFVLSPSAAFPAWDTSVVHLQSGAKLTMLDTTIDAKSKTRAAFVSSGATFAIERSVLTNGVSVNTAPISGNGGAVYIAGGTFTAKDSRLEDNRVIVPTGGGGAISAFGGSTVTLTDTIVKNNRIDVSSSVAEIGGAIIVDGSTLTITRSTFTGNRIGTWGPASQGGNIRATGGSTVNFVDSSLDVRAGFNVGGGIAVNSSTLNVTNSKFTIDGPGDGFGISGGVIASEGSETTITDSEFVSTKAGSKVAHTGGFASVFGGGKFDVKGSSFTGAGGTLATFGGAIAYESGSSVTSAIENSTFKNLRADQSGGAISVSTRPWEASSVQLTVKGSTFTNGGTWDGRNGGAIMVGPGNTAVISGTTIERFDSGWGGGIYNAGTLTLDQGTKILGNSTNRAGGGIFNAGSLTIDEAEFKENLGRTGGNPGSPDELSGASIYAQTDVSVSDKTKFDGGDVRVLDGVSKLVLTGAPQAVSISISEKPTNYPGLDEGSERYLGYMVAQGDGNYVATPDDLAKLSYASNTSDSSPDNAAFAAWKLTFDPDRAGIVVGQSTKLVYDANSGTFPAPAVGARGGVTVDAGEAVQSYDFYTSDDPMTSTAQLTKISAEPTRQGYTFAGWYADPHTSTGGVVTSADPQYDFASGRFIDPSGNPVTSLIPTSEIKVYAGWTKDKVTIVKPPIVKPPIVKPPIVKPPIVKPPIVKPPVVTPQDPKRSGKSGGGLADTGSDMSGLIAFGGALVALGATGFALRRRRIGGTRG